MKRMNCTSIRQSVTYATKNLIIIIKILKKFVITAITQGNIEGLHMVSNLRYKTPTESPVVFHN